jgi:hydrogenase nickel incorporation protein HypA/HybF
MHELSGCLALMSQVERVASEHGARRVGKIVLRIGPLSGVEPALLENAFPIASAGSVAAGAELSIETGPVQVRCSVCGADTEAVPNKLLCGECGDYRTRVIAGEDLLLLSLELETAAGAGPPDPRREEAAASV